MHIRSRVTVLHTFGHCSLRCLIETLPWASASDRQTDTYTIANQKSYDMCTNAKAVKFRAGAGKRRREWRRRRISTADAVPLQEIEVCTRWTTSYNACANNRGYSLSVSLLSYLPLPPPPFCFYSLKLCPALLVPPSESPCIR